MSRRNRTRIVLGIGFCAAIAGIFGAAVGRGDAQGSAPSYGEWAPGVAAPVSALTTLSQNSDIPSDVENAISRAAQATGGRFADASTSLRLLRSTPEGRGAGIYAYRPAGPAVCMVVWPRFGSCPTAPRSDHPGVIFGFSPGGPGYPGVPGELPPVVAGVVADNVREVTVVNNGVASSLDLSNNSFFGVVSRPADGVEWKVEVKFRYANGVERTISFPDPRV